MRASLIYRGVRCKITKVKIGIQGFGCEGYFELSVRRYSSISQPSPERPTLSSGGGSYLGVPYRGVLCTRVEWVEDKTSSIHIQKTLEYLDCDNQVSPKSSPLQGMKTQELLFLLVGEVMNASYKL